MSFYGIPRTGCVCQMGREGFIFFSERDILTRISKVLFTYARTWKSFKMKEMALIYFFLVMILWVSSLLEVVEELRSLRK